MTDARDELAAIIGDYCSSESQRRVDAAADAILAAGWRPLICHHTSGRAPDGGRWCTACGRRLDQVDG